MLLLIYHCIKDIYHFRTSFIRVIFFIIWVVCKYLSVHSTLSTRYICVCKQIMNSCYDGTICIFLLCVYCDHMMCVYVYVRTYVYVVCVSLCYTHMYLLTCITGKEVCSECDHCVIHICIYTYMYICRAP